jgi:hypothetical protein
MAMILEYYDRNYIFPWDYRSQFARPWNRPPSPLPAIRNPTIDQAMQHDATLRRTTELSFSEPYEWYQRGIPRNRRAFALLSEITGFRGFDRPAFGNWTADDVESRLRRYGPYAFFGFWNRFPHVILTVGIIQQGSNTQVVTIDPIRGVATGESLASFNTRMATNMREFNFDGLNPLYLPQTKPIRAVVDH